MDVFTIKAKLVLVQESVNGYINYIFKNQESTSWTNRYIYTVRYPNWEWGFPDVGEIGFLVYSQILAGSKYFNTKTLKEDTYMYDHLRFDKFLRLTEKKKDNRYVI